jgi:hypothetical protein
LPLLLRLLFQSKFLTGVAALKSCHSERSEESPHFAFAFAVACSSSLYTNSKFALVVIQPLLLPCSSPRIVISTEAEKSLYLSLHLPLPWHLQPTNTPFRNLFFAFSAQKSRVKSQNHLTI